MKKSVSTFHYLKLLFVALGIITFCGPFSSVKAISVPDTPLEHQKTAESVVTHDEWNVVASLVNVFTGGMVNSNFSFEVNEAVRRFIKEVIPSVFWQQGGDPAKIFYSGKVGINDNDPNGALSVKGGICWNGNCKKSWDEIGGAALPTDCEDGAVLKSMNGLWGCGDVVVSSSHCATYEMEDRDGNCYSSVTIGEQTWMAKNMRTTKDKDGRQVQSVKPANTPEDEGRFYTYDTASLICPTGWGLPSRDDWNTLNRAVGGEVSQLISGGASGFDALFAGMLDTSGNYATLYEGKRGQGAVFWAEKDSMEIFVDLC